MNITESQMMEMANKHPENLKYTDDTVHAIHTDLSARFGVSIKEIDLMVDSTFQSAVCNINCGDWRIETVINSVYSHVFDMLSNGGF